MNRTKLLFIPRHMIVTGYYGITLVAYWSPVIGPPVGLSYVRPSVFLFLDDNLSKYQ